MNIAREIPTTPKPMLRHFDWRQPLRERRKISASCNSHFHTPPPNTLPITLSVTPRDEGSALALASTQHRFALFESTVDKTQ